MSEDDGLFVESMMAALSQIGAGGGATPRGFRAKERRESRGAGRADPFSVGRPQGGEVLAGLDDTRLMPMTKQYRVATLRARISAISPVSSICTRKNAPGTPLSSKAKGDWSYGELDA